MTDSVKVITISDVTDEAGTQAEISSWISGTVVTSIDHTDVVRTRGDRGMAIIYYTA